MFGASRLVSHPDLSLPWTYIHRNYREKTRARRRIQVPLEAEHLVARGSNVGDHLRMYNSTRSAHTYNIIERAGWR